MPRLHLLGTGASLSGPGRTTTMLALESGESIVLIDCGADPIQRMLAGGLDPRRIDLLILTHEHPDHVSGFPLLVQKLWLANRGRDLDVLGPARALEQARKLFDSFDTTGWKGLPRLVWKEAEAREGVESWSDGTWSIATSPGAHGRTPTAAVRATARESGGVVVYSSDTERSDAVVRLGRGASILVHEATGGFRGHSSAEDAARVAAEADAQKLVLVHLPPQAEELDLGAARGHFRNLELGSDGDVHTF